MVQETRLIRSNTESISIQTGLSGDDTGELFDFFRIDNNDKALIS